MAQARGLPAPKTDNAITFDCIDQVLQVAGAGQVLAMGRAPNIAERLARGILVAPFGAVGPTGAAYYLCRPAGRKSVSAARKIARWLKAEAAENNDHPSP